MGSVHNNKSIALFTLLRLCRAADLINASLVCVGVGTILDFQIGGQQPKSQPIHFHRYRRSGDETLPIYLQNPIFFM